MAKANFRSCLLQAFYRPSLPYKGWVAAACTRALSPVESLTITTLPLGCLDSPIYTAFS